MAVIDPVPPALSTKDQRLGYLRAFYSKLQSTRGDDQRFELPYDVPA